MLLVYMSARSLKRLQGHVQGLQSLMQLMMVKGGLKLKGGRLMRGGIGGNARSLRLQQLRLRRRNDIIMAPLRNVTVTAVASLRNITLTTVAPLSNIAVTVTTVASLRKSLLRESGHSLESFLRSAATARIATATTATAKSRRAPK